ncbi:threonine synthase [Trueperella sp. LYQ143]|uniref:threonine synthase n=1 Tax=Trueperella sp. LYQ143 TaxID=3391059 RepID=UPI00398333D4
MNDDSASAYPARADLLTWRAADGSPLWLPAQSGLTPADIVTTEFSMWRYAATLPIPHSDRVSLGEGCTPLVELDSCGTLEKLEWLNPTSSFKDRGVAMMISQLKALGAQRVLEDSSGNAGSSVAAYARAAGMQATILAPAHTSSHKISQIRSFGATVELISGSRDDVSAAAVTLAQQIPYASHNWNPYFLHGIKTIGYEIWESLAFTLPDNIVTVAGSGSIALGLDLAFTELRQAGQITKSPRIFVGQPLGFDPIVHLANGTTPPPSNIEKPARLAEGASITRPVRGAQVAEVVRRSGGHGVSVSDEQIARATQYLVSRGIFAEPTSALAYAATEILRDSGVITSSEQTVVVLTGTGLKAAEAMAAALAWRKADI